MEGFIPCSIGIDYPLVNSSVQRQTFNPPPPPPHMVNKVNFIPANMPGCQMMSNLNFIPVSSSANVGPCGSFPNIGTFIPQMTPETNRLNLGYVPSKDIGEGSSRFKWNEYKFSWWEQNSFFYYPSFLLSAYYGIKYSDLRKQYNIPKEVTIFGDSGGFQNMSLDATLSPLSVLEWQENNCDVGFIFDNPIFMDDDEQTKIKKQVTTVENGHIALKNRRSQYPLRLYGVIQGHTMEEQKRIINLYKDFGDFDAYDGFSIGGLVPIAGKLSEMTKVLTTFFENFKDDNRPLHILGTSGLNSMTIINYLMMRYKKDHITFDSSTYGSGARRLEWDHLTMNYTIAFQTENPNKLTELPCLCPVCSVVRQTNEVTKGGSTPGAILSLHNLWQYIQYSHFLSCVRKDENIFRKFILSRNDSGLNSGISFIDSVFDIGYDQTMKKYKVTSTPTKSGKQIGIFS